MTITDNGRVDVDELMPAARELVAGSRKVPSKREMQKHLGKSWATVNAVMTRLADEAHREGAQRHRSALQSMRRLAARKHPRSVSLGRLGRQRTVNGFGPSVPTSPGLGPVDPWIHAVPVAAPTAPPAASTAPAPAAPAPQRRRVMAWPLLLLALPAFVAIWSGWVGLGGLTGFGVVHPLPGIADGVSLNTAITLPIGLETYGTFALYVWLSGAGQLRARAFAMWSAIGSLALGALGQVAYHLLVAAGVTAAPWPITTAVACLPVAVLGMGAALYHLVHVDEKES